MKFRIKPIFISHEEAFFRKLPSEKDLREMINKIIGRLAKNIGKYISLDEPVILTSFKDLELISSCRDIDAFIGYRIGGMGHRLLAKTGLLGIPLILIGKSVINYDVAAYVRELGGEVYTPLNYVELNRVLKNLYIRKKLSRSSILYISSKGLPPFSVISGTCNLDKLRKKFGVETISISNEELFKEYSKISDSDVERNFKETVGMARDKFVNDRELFKALRLYKAILNFIEKYDTNMVAISCAEPIYYRERVTPCLSISLLKDRGIPAACEGDLNLLTAMTLLMELSNRAVFIGNLWPYNIDKGIFRISHDVPSTKMRGFEEKGYSYSLYDFHGQKYGVTLYVDLELDRDVTLARMHMSLDKILVFNGKVISSYQGISCRQTLDILVKNPKMLLKKLSFYGHHFALVYGDYVDELIELSEILGLKSEVI